MAIMRHRAGAVVRARAREGLALDPERVASVVGGAWWHGFSEDAVQTFDGCGRLVDVKRSTVPVKCELWPDPRADIISIVREALADCGVSPS
jgi:hypothetical protein